MGVVGSAFSWALALLVLELSFATSTAALVGTSLAAAIVVCVGALACGLDFFGVAVLATYASVFIVATLLSFHLGGAWGFSPTRVMLGWGVAVAATLVASTQVGPGSLDGPAHVAGHPFYELASEESVSTLSVVHLCLTRAAVGETYLLNAYLLLGVAAGSYVIGLAAARRDLSLVVEARTTAFGARRRAVATIAHQRRSLRRRGSGPAR